MANVWTQFKELLPSEYQFIGEVTAIHSDAMSTIQMMTETDGVPDTVRVFGDTVAVGKFALVEGNKIISEVADITTTEQEI